MLTPRRLIALIPAIPFGAILAAVLRAAHRKDLPSFPNQDASATFGDPSLPRLRIVCVGDSSLSGPGLRDIDSIFVRRIARRYADRHHVEVISLAVGGSKATDVIEGQLAFAVELEPDLAVVSVGSNDAIRGVSTGRYRERLDRIIGDLAPAAGAVVVVGMGDFGSIPRLPAILRPYLRRRSTRFNETAAAAAAAHPRAIKVYTRGRMTSAFYEDTAMFAGDQFHAGDTGHGVFAESSESAFDAALAMVEAARDRSRMSGAAAD